MRWGISQRQRQGHVIAVLFTGMLVVHAPGGSSGVAKAPPLDATDSITSAQAPTPYCGVKLTGNNPNFTFTGRCPSALPAGFLNLPEDDQHDLLEAVQYARKSPPRKRRCALPAQQCTPPTAPGAPTEFVWARIQAVKGGHLVHPAALPGEPVVLARVFYLGSAAAADKDTLTGTRAVADDYYIIARRDNMGRARVLFLRYQQDANGQWSRDKNNAADGVLQKCSRLHTHIKPDMADFFECDNVALALPPNVRPRNEYDVWRAFGRFTDSLEAARRRRTGPEDGDAAPTTFRRVAFGRESSDQARRAFSPYDDGGWMTCALGCCSTNRF